MQKEKKEFVLKRLIPYMGRKKGLLPLSLILSGLSAALNIVPFVLVWYITREILSDPNSADVLKCQFLCMACFCICTCRTYNLFLCSYELSSCGISR